MAMKYMIRENFLNPEGIMIVYVMRHAEAVEASETLRDEWRYLTEKGRSSAEKVTAALVGYGPKPRLIITSPLTRAVQTAEIAAACACRKSKVITASEFLLPGGDISELISYVRSCKNAKRVMLVGHEPQLGELVATLLGHTSPAVSLKKGACVAMKLDPKTDEGRADFLWYMTSGKKRITNLKKAFPNK